MFKSINPFNQSVIAEFPIHTQQEVNLKLSLAGKAFKKWKNEPFSVRAQLMKRVAELLRLNKEEYARTITLEMGKVISEARAEIEKCAATCEYYAIHSEEFLANTPLKTELKHSYISYQPTGAVLAIMPWNFPFWQVFRYAVPAIMAGNVTLLKHAPNVCKTSLSLENIFQTAGFPIGVFQSLIVEIDMVEKIIQHDLVQGITLTGSEFAGSQVASIAGRNIKKTVLELGGSDPLIVFSDADLEKAAKVAVQSRMLNAGQVCISAKRFIIHKKVKENFIDLLSKNIAQLVQGNPLEENTNIGPLARLDIAEKLSQQINSTVRAGAHLTIGGQVSGCNFQPSLLDNVQQGMVAYEEETFGPLATVISFDKDEEAVTLANNSRYGLAASIWTRELEKAEVLAKQLDVGGVFINSLVRSDPRWPIGGVKKSGYGRELAEVGIKEFVNTKSIIIESA